MGMYGGGSDAGQQLQQQNLAEQTAVTQGVNRVEQEFAQFTPEFYAKASTDYEKYALPQLGDQYRSTLAQAQADLARSGLTNSSVAANLSRSLGKENANQEENIVNTGIQQSQNLRQDVAQEENTLIGQVQAGESPSLAGIQAGKAAAGFNSPTAFPAVGNLLGNWSSQYLTGNLAQTYAPFGSLGNPFSSIPSVGGGATVGAGTGSSFAIN